MQRLRQEKPREYFDRYAHNLPCTVKIITVEPGGMVSRRYHCHRDQVWVVLDVGAEVELSDEVLRPVLGDELLVPRGVSHRLSCPGERPIKLLGISFGVFDEEGIVCFEDVYERVGPGEDARGAEPVRYGAVGP